MFPIELVSRPLIVHAVKDANLLSLQGRCGQLLVVREDLKSQIPAHWKAYTEFHPGILESIVIRLNPRHNLRRSTLETFVPRDC